MADVIKLVQGDTPVVQIALYDKRVDTYGNTTIVPVDLTNVSAVALKWRAVGSVAAPTSIAGTPQSPLTAGIVWFTFSAGVLATALGAYEAEVEITTNSGQVFTVYDEYKFHVRADF